MTQGIDRSLWEARQKTERRWMDLERRAAAALAHLRQAAVPLERLTGAESWDQFLRLGEQRQEDDRKELAAAAQRLASAAFMSGEDLARLRWLAALLQSRIEARQELLDLPKVILKTLSEVKE